MWCSHTAASFVVFASSSGLSLVLGHRRSAAVATTAIAIHGHRRRHRSAQPSPPEGAAMPGHGGRRTAVLRKSLHEESPGVVDQVGGSAVGCERAQRR